MDESYHGATNEFESAIVALFEKHDKNEVDLISKQYKRKEVLKFIFDELIIHINMLRVTLRSRLKIK